MVKPEYKNLQYAHRTARWFECLDSPTPSNVEDFENVLHSLFNEVSDCHNRRQLNIKFGKHSGTHINKMVRVLESPHVKHAIEILPSTKKQSFVAIMNRLLQHLHIIKAAGYVKNN
jgi:hypothetical protein